MHVLCDYLQSVVYCSSVQFIMLFDVAVRLHVYE